MWYKFGQASIWKIYLILFKIKNISLQILQVELNSIGTFLILWKAIRRGLIHIQKCEFDFLTCEVFIRHPCGLYYNGSN